MAYGHGGYYCDALFCADQESKVDVERHQDRR